MLRTNITDWTPEALWRTYIQLTEAEAAFGLRLDWSIRAEWDDWSRHSEGCYVLRTNIPTGRPRRCGEPTSSSAKPKPPSASTRASCRSGPIWHQREDRVLAHILVCFLAYVLWKTLEQWQSRAGLGNSPRTILQELAAIHSTDVVLPTATVAATRTATALCRAPRSRPGRLARPPRATSARTAPHAPRLTPIVVPTCNLSS